METMTIIDNICLRYGCSECCNPVKINSRILINSENKELPFVELGDIFVPISHPDSVRLRTYSCHFFNCETGLCNDYFNRPDICRNTKCAAFDEITESGQIEIINSIKREIFLKISKG